MLLPGTGGHKGGLAAAAARSAKRDAGNAAHYYTLPLPIHRHPTPRRQAIAARPFDYLPIIGSLPRALVSRDHPRRELPKRARSRWQNFIASCSRLSRSPATGSAQRAPTRRAHPALCFPFPRRGHIEQSQQIHPRTSPELLAPDIGVPVYSQRTGMNAAFGVQGLGGEESAVLEVRTGVATRKHGAGGLQVNGLAAPVQDKAAPGESDSSIIHK